MADKTKFDRNRVFTLNEPLAPRLNPALACEIGLNESILFLQLEFLIAVSENYRDGQWWTYQSEEELRNQFPFWSKATINRAVHSLQDQGLIQVGNYNVARYDRTRWFAIDFAGAEKLKSISVRAASPRLVSQVGGHESRSTQNESGSAQYESGSAQYESTIPETPSEITTENGGASAPPTTTISSQAKKAKPHSRRAGAEPDFFSETEAEAVGEGVTAVVSGGAKEGSASLSYDEKEPPMAVEPSGRARSSSKGRAAKKQRESKDREQGDGPRSPSKKTDQGAAWVERAVDEIMAVHEGHLPGLSASELKLARRELRAMLLEDQRPVAEVYWMVEYRGATAMHFVRENWTERYRRLCNRYGWRENHAGVLVKDAGVPALPPEVKVAIYGQPPPREVEAPKTAPVVKAPATASAPRPTAPQPKITEAPAAPAATPVLEDEIVMPWSSVLGRVEEGEEEFETIFKD